MKGKLIFILLLGAFQVAAQPAGSVNSAGQTACSGFTEPFYWGRLTDSRAEAMGMTVATTSENTNTSFYNPAGLGTLSGIQVSGTFATPYYNYGDATFGYFTAGGKINDYIKVQFSRFGYRSNYKISFHDVNGELESSEDQVNTYTLGLASEPIKNWFFGVNMKLTAIGVIEGEFANSFLADVGMIKRFELAKEEGHHTIDLGASVMNFTGNDLDYKVLGTTTEDALDAPVTGLFGVSYRYSSIHKKVAEKLDLFGASFQANYVNQLDLKERNGFRMGAEFAFAEILYLRAGYYYRNTCDFGSAQIYPGNIQSFTYGIGLRAPLDKLTNLPLQMNIDFAKLPQPSYGMNTQEDDFISLNFRVNWSF